MSTHDRFEVIHGDCLEVMAGMEAGSVDAVVTDPPYCSGGRQQAGARMIISKNRLGDSEWFMGDNMGTDTYLWFMRQIAGQCFRLSSNGSPAYVFTDWRQYTTVVTAWESVGWTLKNVVVWDRAKGGAMGSWWRSNHEWVPVFVKGKARPLSGAGFYNTWTGTKPHGGEHPTEKPVRLCRYLVSSITPETAIILDPFTGSGTTGVACVEEGRDFIGIERELDYVTIARRRIEAAAAQERLPV